MTRRRTQQSKDRAKRRRERFNPAPLPMPVFGSPANGQRCVTCLVWFHRDHYWRSKRNAHAKRCRPCITANKRQP